MSEQLHDQSGARSPEDPAPAAAPGPGIELTPVPPGASLLVLGVVLAVLAPLGGFLAGSMADSGGTTDRVSAMFLSLFAGFVLGGVGIALAGLGGLRLWRHRAAGPDGQG